LYPLTIMGDTINPVGDTVLLYVDVLQTYNYYLYKWSPCDSTTTVGCNASAMIAQPMSETIYTLTATTLPEYGACEQSTNFRVKTSSGILPYTAFTPNSDGTNDYWIIKNAEGGSHPNMVTNIYNRWGEPVINPIKGCPATDATYGGCQMWDGRSKKGIEVPVGVYYFVIDPGDGTELIKGTLTISR